MGLIGKLNDDQQIADLNKKLSDLGPLWVWDGEVYQDDPIEESVLVMSGDAVSEVMGRSADISDFHSKVHAYCKKRIALIEKAEVAGEVAAMIKEMGL